MTPRLEREERDGAMMFYDTDPRHYRIPSR